MGKLHVTRWTVLPYTWVAGIAAGLLLAGCGGASLTSRAQDRSALSEQIEVAMHDLSGQGVSASACPANQAYRDELVDVLAAFVSSPEARRFDARALETIFNSAGSDVPWNLGGWPEILLDPGPDDAMLVTAHWCGRGMGRWLYVIDRSGEAWLVDTPIVDSMGWNGLDADVRWLDGVWTVMQMTGSMQQTTELIVVGPDGDGWAVLYPQDDRGRHTGMVIAPNWEPVVEFDDGYQQMVVTWFEGRCGMQVTHDWEQTSSAGRYVERSRRELTPRLCD
jgi:hypothetical protein